MIKIALIGLGYWGKNYLRVLKLIPEVDLIYVYDSDSSKFLNINREIIAKDLEQIVEDKNIEAVIKDGDLLKFIFYNRFIFNSINIIDPRFIRIFKGNIIYEYPVPLIMENLVKKGDIVIDIGAYDGIYTTFLSKLVRKEGKVYAFEPDPSAFKVLKKNVEINKLSNVILENKAVYSKTTKMKLYFEKELSAGASLIDEFKNFIEVETVALDDYFQNQDIEIDLIKMDIQGAEYAALLGMKNLLSKRKVKYLIIEYTPYLLVKYGINPNDLIELLEKYGFEIYEIDEDKYAINKVNIEEMNKKYTDKNYLYTNLLCIFKKN